MPPKLIPVLRFACVLCVCAALSATAATLRVTAPSPPGSSWDLLAQTLKSLADTLPRSDRLEVVNIPGSGGTVGLGRFLSEPGDGVLVTGLTMLDATLLQRAPVTLDRLTPIARLAVEPFAVAVPAGSAWATIDDLRLAMWGEPGRVTWAGGPAGSIDHVAAALLARAVGVDPVRLNYVPFLATGDAVAALADGKVAAAIVSRGEVATESRAGRLRILATSGAAADGSGDAPTLAAAGIPLVFTNWRGLVGRPDMSRTDQEKAAALTMRLAGLPDWQTLLDRKDWQPGLLGPAEFGQFLKTEQARVKDALKALGMLRGDPMRGDPMRPESPRPDLPKRPD